MSDFSAIRYQGGDGSIAGHVFNDKNSNGVSDGIDAPIANWIVYLDANNNNQLDLGDTATTTDATGAYKFEGLADDTFHLKQILATGHRKTLPASGTSGYNVTLSGQTVTAKDFGATTRTSSSPARCNNDANSNGVMDAGENQLDGVTVNIVSNGQIIATRTTNEFGFWQVKGLSAGTGSAEIVLPGIWQPTNPAGGKYSGSMTSGERNQNLNFGLIEVPAPLPVAFAGFSSPQS